MDFVSRSGSTARSSRAYASSTSPWAVGPADDLRQLVPPHTPAHRPRCGPMQAASHAVTGPTPGITPTGIGAQRPDLGARLDHPAAVRFGQLTGHLRDELGGAPRPTDAVSPPVTATTWSPAGRPPVRRPPQMLSVDGPAERPAGRRRPRPAKAAQPAARGRAAGPSPGRWPSGMPEPAGQKGGVRAAAARLERPAWPSGPRTPGPRTTRWPPPPLADPAHHHRLAAQRRLIALLDRGEEGVEVQCRTEASRRTAPFSWVSPRIAATYVCVGCDGRAQVAACHPSATY